jgi:hypothetical protein
MPFIDTKKQSVLRTGTREVLGKLKYARACLRQARRMAEEYDLDLEEREFVAHTVGRVRQAVTAFEAAVLAHDKAAKS